jgi:type II secretory pathway component GspD/PulD (secretin)
MKTVKSGFLLLVCVGGLIVTAAAQPTDSPANAPQHQAPPPQVQTPPPEELPPAPPFELVPSPGEPVPPPGEMAPIPGELERTPGEQAPPAGELTPRSQETTPPPAKSGDATVGSELRQFSPPLDHVVADGEKGLRLNFRNAPLEMVLNYLSDAAGFVIVPEVDVRGQVDVWSNQPLTKEEAIDVLNSVLSKNGYAALQNGRMLFIINKDQAKTRDVPVKTGGDPDLIPKSEEIVTQIIPVKFISATQLIRDLQPLLPTTTSMTANEGGNSLVLTDTQTNIRRMAEIVKALDTVLSSVSSVRVFSLQYADAKSLATVVKELFQSQQDSSRNSDARSRFFFRGPGGGGQGGQPGGEGGSTSGTGGGRAPTPRVVAVADERSNSLVVSAPVDQMPIIEDLVKQVDTNVEDITEVRVFRLKYADAQETADLLTSLFPENNSTQGNRSRIQFGPGGGPFGGPFGGGFGQRGGSTSDKSERMLKENRVVAVPDLRTRSVVVSAARDLMPQIANMIEELDSDPARKQKVFVFPLENTDPQAVQEVLQSLFPSQNYGNYGANRSTTRGTTRQVGNQLNNRATQMQNQGSTRSSSFGGNNSLGSGVGSSTGR